MSIEDVCSVEAKYNGDSIRITTYTWMEIDDNIDIPTRYLNELIEDLMKIKEKLKERE